MSRLREKRAINKVDSLGDNGHAPVRAHGRHSSTLIVSTWTQMIGEL